MFCSIEIEEKNTQKDFTLNMAHTLRKLKAKCNMCIFQVIKSTTICLKGGKLVDV